MLRVSCMARALMTSRASALRAAPRLQRLVVPVGSIAAQSGAVIAQNRMLATIQGNRIRVGHVIEFEGKLWKVLKAQVVRSGKGGAFMACDLKDVASSSKKTVKFRSEQTIQQIDAADATEAFQFLYRDGNKLVLMHATTFEQKEVDVSVVDDAQLPFLEEGMQVELAEHEGSVIQFILPRTAVMEIVDAEPTSQGTERFIMATLKNGAKVRVPPFVTVGTKIVYNIHDGEYVNRAENQ